MLADDTHAEPLYLTALGEDLTRWPWIRSRIELAYGTWLRRRGRVDEARSPLRSALGTLDCIGARPWADQTRRVLSMADESG